MYLTYLDSNSWLVEIGGQNILIDPWLVGSLTFANLDWLFKGSRSQERAIPEKIDLILLSQGLEDHAHPPTLKQLDRNIPVVASVNAAKVVNELNYQQVNTLAHGESFTLNGSVEITATPGSPIGPNLLENGYLLKELESGFTVYYEPHGYHSELLKKSAPVDVVITPLIDLCLPLIGPIIKGKEKALELAKWLEPQIMLPTAAGGDVTFEGLLMNLIKPEGTVADFRTLLQQHNISAQILEPKSGDRTQLNLQKRVVSGIYH
ncbi:MAG: MBL fold metallo-hydrolase [Nostocales cyanobacterium 94392]|nr:MBL fold metallo-hydrolase [Nostocales cyanobacterium 94392]